MPPETPDPNLVRFIGDATTEVPDDRKDRLRSELATVFQTVSTQDRPPCEITVSRCFTGYSPCIDDKIVLGVEVRYRDGPESHIVKLGRRDKVKPDSDGWEMCTRGRPVSSRIFAPMRPVELPDQERFAVLYRDAYTLFGLNREKNRPWPLQEVARWAVMDDEPSPDSVERIIAQLYTDLGVWFYPGARVDREPANRFYRDHLGMDIAGSEPADQAKKVLCRWKTDDYRRHLRRDTVWVLCGQDKPTARPKTDPPRYLDPLEFVEWVLANPTARLPDTLVGRAHGDLHALNVLVGVRRGEAEFPVVFDYGEMKSTNVLVWDFVKLETELKVRLLPALLYDPAVRERLLTNSKLLPKTPLRELAPRPTERVDRLRMFLAFEERLHDLTSQIESKEDAEPIRSSSSASTGVAKLDRLLAVLLRIRKEAAIRLGFDQYKRQHLWRDEYGFALAVSGLLNVKWDYEPPQAECALVSAGTAVARMPTIAVTLDTETDYEVQLRAQDHPVPSYRVPLAAVHGCWADKQYDRARLYVEHMVFGINGDEAATLERFFVRPEVWHAIPLIAEAALIEIESGRLVQVEELLKELRQKALAFGDHETLARLGRLFKDWGDLWWEKNNLAFDDFEGKPGWQLYRQARQVYEEAFEATADYYTGINAATLALLTHDSAAARRHAQHVAELCAAVRELPREERPWLFASEGEAAIILGKKDGNGKLASVGFYAKAIDELIPSDGGKANSMYKQLCRLWKVVPHDVVEVLGLFETGRFRRSLSSRYLGRDFDPSSS